MKKLTFYRYYPYLYIILSFAIFFPLLLYGYFLIDPRNNHDFNVFGYLYQIFAAYLIFFISFIVTKSYQRIYITTESVTLKGFKNISVLEWNEIAYFYQRDGLYSKFYCLENIDRTIKISFNLKKKNMLKLIDLCSSSEIEDKMRQILFK